MIDSLDLDNEKNIFSVTRLNSYIKTLFDHTPTLKMIHLQGEIYDLKRSGPHAYYMLKDETSSIRGVLFYADTINLDPRIKNGDAVLISGSVSVYPQKGQYQVYAKNITLFGQGALLIELEKLKKKLAAEGLFNPERKRHINLYPETVGLISAKNSAAIQDMVVNLKRRYPLAKIYVFDTLVQGEGAAKDIIRAFKLSTQYPLDTLIIGRGGGASEDLGAFNDEQLIRTIATSKVPIISAVGHEIDVTLVDLVSDARASTPTGAVELASVDSREIIERMNEARLTLNRLLFRQLELYQVRLDNLKKRPVMLSPLALYDNRLAQLKVQQTIINNHTRQALIQNTNAIKQLKYNLNSTMKNNLSIIMQRFVNLKPLLDNLDPEKILRRGYAINRDKHGKIIKTIADLQLGDLIQTQLHDGSFSSEIKEMKKNGK